MTSSTKPLYAGHRFPPELISDTVWLYYRFPLSHRMVEERLAFRGIAVSHETIRQWGLKFGRAFANLIRRRLPRPGDKWHLDEVVLKIAGKTHYLWRAVDQHGAVLDVLVQSRRDRKAAKRRLRKLLKRQCRAPRVMITDRLKSYGAAKREIRPGVEHRQHNGLNNRAENSHQPTRRRQRPRKRFNSARQAQRFLSARDPINNLFRLPRLSRKLCLRCQRQAKLCFAESHRLPATDYRAERARAVEAWHDVCGIKQAASPAPALAPSCSPRSRLPLHNLTMPSGARDRRRVGTNASAALCSCGG
jgi:putative transposase